MNTADPGEIDLSKDPQCTVESAAGLGFCTIVSGLQMLGIYSVHLYYNMAP